MADHRTYFHAEVAYAVQNRYDLLGGVRLFGGPIRRRYFKRPDAFRQIARLDDRRLDRVLAFLVRRERVVPGGNEEGAV